MNGKLVTQTFSNGKTIPIVGYGAGTAWFKRNDETALNLGLVQSIKLALDKGFRHVDTAEMYGTDEEVGMALRETHVPRQELFITSKLLKSLADVKGATQRIVQLLGVGHLDMMLMHAPFLPDGMTLEQAWKDMEDLVDCGLATSIGVSNFRVEDLQKLLAIARIKPVINQVEFHPYLQQPELHEFCRSQGIVMSGYSGLMPLTGKKGGPLDAVVEDIAKSRHATPAQVLMMWGIQKGAVVMTTSGQEQRMVEYLQAVEAASPGSQAASPAAGLGPLTEEEMGRIDAAGSKLAFRKFWSKEFGFKEEAADTPGV